ncbi:uncharacterized protein isoform X2 [Musca autumnalis]|uniref:uncharacterized protein isoform X2 n=1 Tax=Musca autumnalis TaxID=221902 RepID=UPI003CF0C1C8
MSDEEFERHKEALAVKKLEKSKTVFSQFIQFYSEITLAQYHFDRNETEVAILRTSCCNAIIGTNYTRVIPTKELNPTVMQDFWKKEEEKRRLLAEKQQREMERAKLEKEQRAREEKEHLEREKKLQMNNKLQPAHVPIKTSPQPLSPKKTMPSSALTEAERMLVLIPLQLRWYVYWGEYPLSFAACLSQEECFRLVLARGADPDSQDTNGNTVLHMMAIYEKIDMFDVAYEICEHSNFST